MKSRFFIHFVVIAFLILNGCANMPPVEDGIVVPLDRAIREAAQRFKAELDEGTTVAVLKFNSSSPRFDDYVMQEIELALVGGKRLVIKERKNLQDIRDLINSEYQSGYVSDDTLVSIAKELGTQVVIIGDLFDMDDTYRFRIRAVMNETATIETAYAVDIHPNERKVRNLMNGKRPQKIQLAETDTLGFFERNKSSSRKIYVDLINGGVAWGEGIGIGLHALDVYYSPLPYLSLGIAMWDANLFVSENIDSDILFLPIRIGFLFPITEKITLTGYGTLNWLGGYYNPGEVVNGVKAPEKYYDRYLVGYKGWVGIMPGIKTGLLFNIGNNHGLSINYYGYWTKNEYVNSIGVGYWIGKNL